MQITDGRGRIPAAQSRAVSGGRKEGAGFSSVLEKRMTGAVEVAAESPAEGTESSGGRADGGRLVSLGVLSREDPTVSDLLIRHPTLGESCWEIIHDQRNSAKAFRRIQAGTEIFVDRKTDEILWNGEAERALASSDKGGAPPAGRRSASPLEARLPQGGGEGAGPGAANGGKKQDGGGVLPPPRKQAGRPGAFPIGGDRQGGYLLLGEACRSGSEVHGTGLP